MAKKYSKSVFVTLLAISISFSAVAQEKLLSEARQTTGNFSSQDITRYNIMVFQNNEIANKIRDKWEMQVQGLENRGASRGFLDDVYGVTKNSTFGLMSTGVTGMVSTGVNLLGNMLKSKKGEWKQIIQNENRFEKTLFMLENLNDFYSNISTTGALDPNFMSFNGFGCLQMRGNDTILYIACHLDTTEIALSHILRHSKFKLKLDTLIFNPSKCNLPNDSALHFSERQPFSFTQRKDLNLRIDINVTSSWINQAIQVYNDQKLGRFYLQFPIQEKYLDTDSIFRYYRGISREIAGCEILGDCFIVPRSYIGVRDNYGNFHDAWGTGQYKLSMTIKETCNITPEFEQNWKTDWKRRKKSQPGSFNIVQEIRQTWNKNASQWIVTILEAPANYATQEMLQSIGLTNGAQQSPSSNAAKTVQTNQATKKISQ